MSALQGPQHSRSRQTRRTRPGWPADSAMSGSAARIPRPRLASSPMVTHPPGWWSQSSQLGVASHRIQLVRHGVVHYPHVRSSLRKSRPCGPYPGRGGHVQPIRVHVVRSRHSWLCFLVQHRGLRYGARPTWIKPAHHIQELSHLPVPGQQERTRRRRTTRPRVGRYVVYLHRVAEGSGPSQPRTPSR